MFAAAIIRKNALAKITPFDTAVRNIAINPKDSVATNAEKLAIHGGGTDCGCALAYLNAGNRKADAVMFISDNQSWVQSSQTRSNETPMMREWQRFKERNRRRSSSISISRRMGLRRRRMTRTFFKLAVSRMQSSMSSLISLAGARRVFRRLWRRWSLPDEAPI